MPHFELIVTITAGLATALVFGFVMYRLGLSPIVGYLLAGILVGPRTPGFVANEKVASELAEVGVILLMFGVGLQFHFRELLAVKRVALWGGLGQIAVATGVGTLLARMWGYEISAAVIFGLSLSIASTVVLVRVLSEQRHLHSVVGKVALGWLVVEDIFTVFALVALPLLFGPEAAKHDIGLSLLLSGLKLVALVAVVALIGRRAIPSLFGYVAATRSRELFTLTVLVTALGIAVASATLFGASMALGAFLAGVIVGQSEFSARAASDALPMRDAFAVLFFVSVGMLFDPSALLNHPGHVLGALGVVMLVKPLVAYGIMRALRNSDDMSLPVSAVLAQIGEFSFVLASASTALGVLPREAASILVVTSILATTVNPGLYRLAVQLGARRAKGRALDLTAKPSKQREGDLAVVIGHGPTGQVVTEILRGNGIEVTVVDLNLETTRELATRGLHTVYGDAARPDVLEQAGLADARALFLTTPSFDGLAEIIRAAKEVNPEIQVYARSEFLGDVGNLTEAGADSVVTAEGEVALAMASELLTELGASPEELDRERDRVHVMLHKRILERASVAKALH
ncbi:MAG: cation:proton antiporter [Myxococcales bacterium]